MTEFAFFRLPDGHAWLGLGPFAEHAEMPAGTAFYWNNFDLSDPKPWKVPARLVEVRSMEDLQPLLGDATAVQVMWEKPPTEGFKMAFRRIRREVLAARLQKMVPVLTERGKVSAGQPASLLKQVLAAPANLWGYAHVGATSGFLGATPELLFRTHGTQVETMALAGTAKPGAGDSFLTDLKEIEEHEIVARFLMDRLSSLGVVERDARDVCETAGLRHFQSWLRVTASTAPRPDDLVRLLHPTPAVGCLPRSEEWLDRLREYRTLLKVPGFFGAPFGFSHEGTQHFVVSIRGLGWDGDVIHLPSGCGIVGGSAFDHEWRELRLKREAVVRMLGCG